MEAFHTELINFLIKQNQYKSYLEIGMADPKENYLLINCNNKESIDPYTDNENYDGGFKEIPQIVIDNLTYHMTSDEAFNIIPHNKKYDIIFIDGLHLEEQVDKDIYNSLKHLSDDGCIIVHDTLPYEEENQTEIRNTIEWNGSVWKSIPKLQDVDGISYFTIDENYGCTIIRKNGNIGNFNFNKSPYTWADFKQNKNQLMNIITTEDFYQKAEYYKFRANKNYSTLLCCIVKQENIYLRDFIEYYKKLGFTNIVLYDNNDKDGEYPQQVIGDYIADGFVIYKDIRGKYRYQLKAYDECYANYKDKYDWIAFFDVDEFLDISGNRSIDDFLSQEKFNNIFCITLYWMIYGDNNLLHYDSRPVYERFTISNEPDKEKNTFKLIFRGKRNIDINFLDANAFRWNNYDNIPIIVVNTDNKDLTFENLYANFSYNDAYLKHYNTLTIEEFLYRRFGRRSYADRASSFNKERIMKIFTDINEMTEEKQNIINDFFNKFEIKEDNI